MIEFDRVVRLPLMEGAGGRVIRFSFDRVTHQENGEMRLCEVVGTRLPSRSVSHAELFSHRAAHRRLAGRGARDGGLRRR